MRADLRRRGLRPLLAFATGAALSLAFPGPLQQYGLAWYALVPLFALLRFATPREGFRLGFIFGLGFWLCSLSWLMELRNNGGPVALVAVGLVGLSAWCALFSGLFGFATAALWRGGDSAAGGWRRTGFETWRPFAVALFWCGGEYLRSTLFTGFAWNALGVSMVALPFLDVTSAGLGEGGARLVQRTMLPVVQLAGYWQYYGVTGNGRSLCKFWRLVVVGLYKWLNRRSQKRGLTWMRLNAILKRHGVPEPRITESRQMQFSFMGAR